MTLTETLLVLLLVAILATISAPSFLTWLNKEKVDNSLLRLVGAVKEAQNEAIKRSQNCSVQIPKGTDQTITSNCFVSGIRKIREVRIDHLQNNGGPGIWEITFDYKGRYNQADYDAGVDGMLVLSVPNSSAQQKCLVISDGIGLMRTGDFAGGLINTPNCVAP